MGLSHGQTVLVIYGICILLAVMSLVLSGTQQAYAFMGLVVAFGLVLFLVTRGESGDALEAETYEPADSDLEGPPAAGEDDRSTDSKIIADVRQGTGEPPV